MFYILLAILTIMAIKFVLPSLMTTGGYIQNTNEREKIPIWNKKNNIFLYIISIIFFANGMFSITFFYADPGYQYHVRTVFGEERKISTLGYSYYGAGTYIPWKNDMTVQSASNIGATNEDQTSDDDRDISANLVPPKLIFLDQVDSKVSATARFTIPQDEETFFKMVHAYRTPANLLNTELIPAFKTTLQATSSLMTAEKYFSGGRTEFINEFDEQLRNGIYVVKRIATNKHDSTKDQMSSANAAKNKQAKWSSDRNKVVYIVKKQRYTDGSLKRTKQNFHDYGISVVSARVTDMVPNDGFNDRMKKKQQASADVAIAREDRIKEEEKELYVIAKGNREVAERQAKAKVVQIEKTTNALTQKQLVLTKALQKKEQAEIDKQTATILFDKAKIDAKAIKVAADAEAYKRIKIIKSDNALQAKIDAEIQIQKVWAKAYAKRNVPTTVFGTTNGTPTGSDSEVSNFMKLMTLQAAKSLDYSRAVK